jgi:T5SS/PEP-CTERM-associated repeat protein/autotransporter-associated beta strand protein
VTGGSVTSGGLTVGYEGTGTLNVNGGRVTNPDGYLGYNAGSVGTATVSSGTWANSGDLTVGYEATGTLNVTGGKVTNASGFIGYNVKSVGTATVSSGTWANSGGLAVGNSGTGTLEVTGGTVTNDAIGYIGHYADGHGTATVSSGTWANGNLAVGNYGTGILNVTGGSVTNTNGYIGRFADSDGTATVSSGTWASSGNLTVGDEGTGSLTMSGGLVTVGGTLLRRAGGTIHLNSGGTLQIGTGTTGGVLGNNLTNNGTLIFNRSDAYTYGGIISGTGSVTKQGGGTLTLGAANSYSGLTTISAGTLALSGIGSIGKGGLGLGTTGSPGVFDLSGRTAGTYSLPATGNLAGVGTLSGNGKSLAVLGSFTPGNSPGTVTLGSGLSLDLSNSGSSVFEITDPAYTAGTYDLVNGDGSVVFGGILNLAFSGGSYADGTDVLQLFANNGGRSGNFSAVNATGLAAGQSATFNPATGFITVVPEPSTCASLLAGLAYGGSVMFRRRRAR